MTARLYLTVYAKDDLPTETAHVASKSLGTVNEALSDLQFRDELHGTGGIVARINRHHAQASLFQEDRYVLVHSDFGVVGGAFLREGTIDLSSNDGPGGEFMTWIGPGPMSILSNAVMDYDSNITGGHNPIDGYWDLSAQGPLAGNDNGHPIPMLKRALVEAQLQTPNAISVVDHSSWDYDADTNAAVPPTWTGSYGVNVGDDLLTIVGQFDQLGGVFFRMSHFFKLDAYLSYGTDKSGAFGAGTVRFEKGVNVSAAIDRKVRGSVHVTHLIVGGADRTFTTAVDPTYASPQVIRYGFLSVPETSDTSSLQEAGLAHIAARKRQTDAWSFPLHDHGTTPASGIYEPGNHYKVGDTVSLHTGTGEYDANEQAAPVAAIEWKLKTGQEANGDYWIIPEIGSTFHWGGTGSFQGRDAPGSQHRFVLCQGGTIAAITCDNAVTVGTAFTLSEPGLEGGYGNWYDGFGQTQRSSAQARTGTWSYGPTAHRWHHLVGQSFTAGKRYVLKVYTKTTGAGSLTSSITFGKSTTSTASLHNHLGFSDFTTSTFDDRPDSGGGWVERCVVWEPTSTYAGDVRVEIHVSDAYVDDLAVYEGTITATVDPSSGDIPQDVGANTEASVGTSVRAARCDHIHEHSDLSDHPAETHHHASSVEFTPTGTTAATNVQTAIAEEATDRAVADAAHAADTSLHGSGVAVVTDHASMGAAETFDFTDGSDHEGVQDANLTVTLTGATDGEAAFLTLVLTQDGTGGRTLTLPASVVNGSDIESAWVTTAGATNVLSLFSYDGGANWYGFLAGGSSVGALDDLSDVTITSSAAADRLRYDGSGWVNSNLHWEPMVTYDGIVMLDSGGNPHMHEVSH